MLLTRPRDSGTQYISVEKLHAMIKMFVVMAGNASLVATVTATPSSHFMNPCKSKASWWWKVFYVPIACVAGR